MKHHVLLSLAVAAGMGGIACSDTAADETTTTELALNGGCVLEWPCWQEMAAANPGNCDAPLTTAPTCTWHQDCIDWLAVPTNCVACPGVDTTWDPFDCTVESGGSSGGGPATSPSTAAALLVSDMTGAGFSGPEQIQIEGLFALYPSSVANISAYAEDMGTWLYELHMHPYMASCHDGVSFTMDLALDPTATLRILEDGVELAAYSAADNGTDVQTAVFTAGQGTSFDFEYTVIDLTSAATPGFSVHTFGLSSASSCSVVETLGNSTMLRIAIPSAEAMDAFKTAIMSALPNAFVEADPLMSTSIAYSSGPITSSTIRNPVEPADADPWNWPLVTSIPELINVSGSTAQPNAWDQHLGGHPGVVILQIDDRLNTLAELASGDIKPAQMYFHGTEVSGSGPCASYGGCVPPPISAGFSHSSLVAPHIWAKKNGAEWSGASPKSTRWHAGLSASIFDLDVGKYFTQVSEFIAFLNTIEPDDIDVITMSAGTALPTYAMQTAVRRHTDAGVIFVAAVGNECSGEPLYPAAFADVVAVGSAGTYDVDTETWIDLDEPSQFENGCSNSEPDVVAVGAGPMPVSHLLADVCEDLTTLCTSAADCNGIGGGTCLPTGTPAYYQYPLAGTSFSTPHAAALAANMLAELIFRNPMKYPSLAGLSKPDRADVVRAAIMGGADDLGPSGYDLGTGWGRINHLGALELLQAGEAPAWIPNLFSEHVADLEQNIVDDTNQIVGPMTTTDFDIDIGAKIGSCGWAFAALIIGAFLPPTLATLFTHIPVKIVFKPPHAQHRVTGYQHWMTPASGGQLELRQEFVQSADVKFTLELWSPMACIIPFIGPTKLKFDLDFEPAAVPGTTTLITNMELGGLGYEQASNLIQRPDYHLDVNIEPFVLQPIVDLALLFFDDEIEQVEDLLEEHIIPSVEMEAIDMMEDVLDNTLLHDRIRPMKFFEERFGPSAPGYLAPVMKHWDLLSTYDHQYLAPTTHLDSMSQMVLHVPELSDNTGVPAYIDGVFTDVYTPPMLGEDADLTSYQSSVLVDYMLNIADLHGYHHVDIMRFVVTSEDVSDIVIEVQDVRVSERMIVSYFDQPTPEGYYGIATLRATADLYTCTVDALDQDQTLCGTPEDPLLYQGEIELDITVDLLRKNVYAANWLSEVGEAGTAHRFELRETPDWRTARLMIVSPTSWFFTEGDVNEDVTRTELETLLVQTYGPKLHRLMQSVSYDRWGLNADLGENRLTLEVPLNFMTSYVLDLIENLQFNGYNLNFGTFDATDSEPAYQLLDNPIASWEAPAFATLTDLAQGGGGSGPAPSAGVQMSQSAIGIHYGRCILDPSTECRSDDDCMNSDTCGNRYYCEDTDPDPIDVYPLQECYWPNPVCTGSGMTGECLVIPGRTRYANRFDVSWSGGAKELAESRDGVYFTGYEDGGFLSTTYATDLWQMTLAPVGNDWVMVPDHVGDLARANHHEYTVTGFKRDPLSLIRTDECLEQWTADLTFDRWNLENKGPDGECGTPDDVNCSSMTMKYRQDYRLSQTSAHRDTSIADLDCDPGGGPSVIGEILVDDVEGPGTEPYGGGFQPPNH